MVRLSQYNPTIMTQITCEELKLSHELDMNVGVQTTKSSCERLTGRKQSSPWQHRNIRAKSCSTGISFTALNSETTLALHTASICG